MPQPAPRGAGIPSETPTAKLRLRSRKPSHFFYATSKCAPSVKIAWDLLPWRDAFTALLALCRADRAEAKADAALAEVASPKRQVREMAGLGPVLMTPANKKARKREEKKLLQVVGKLKQVRLQLKQLVDHLNNLQHWSPEERPAI